MKLPIYQLSTFSESVFGGNPAAVCVLDRWFDDALLGAIAREQNISATAFLLPGPDNGAIRYFTPAGEFAFIGHASLAAATVLLRVVFPDRVSLDVTTNDQTLRVTRAGNQGVAMTLPAAPPMSCDLGEALAGALRAKVLQTWVSSAHYFALCENEAAVRSLKPDLALIKTFDRDTVVATAQGEDCSFVSRAFAPNEGLDEDPVCGSAHLTLVPYWSQRLEQRAHRALQLSERGGELFCSTDGENVTLAGHCALYLEGSIRI